MITNSVIYYPTVNGEWPEARVPLLVFTHGINQEADNYPYLFNAIAEMGIAVISIESGLSAQPDARERSIACALAWAGWDDPSGGYELFEDHLTCDLIVGGHSNGGQAAWQFVRDRDPLAFYSSYWFDFTPRALFTFGSRHEGEETLDPMSAPPYYALLGALDNDTRHDAVTQYDGTPLEEEAGANLRIIHILHDTGHNDVGGDMGLFSPPVVADDKAEFAALEYVTRFIDWQVFDNNVEENRRFLLLEQFSADVVDPAAWVGANGYGQLTGGSACASSSDPVMCAERPGCLWDAGIMDCEDWPCSDSSASPEECDGRWACAWDDADDECVDRPMVFANFTLGESETTRQVFQAFPDASVELQSSPSLEGQYDIGLATELDDDLDLNTYHNTTLMRVDWGRSPRQRAPSSCRQVTAPWTSPRSPI